MPIHPPCERAIDIFCDVSPQVLALIFQWADQRNERISPLPRPNVVLTQELTVLMREVSVVWPAPTNGAVTLERRIFPRLPHSPIIGERANG